MFEQKSDNDLRIIQEWITKQPHLPQNIHGMMLRRFLHVCNNSIEQTKTLIDLFYTIRCQAPEIFDDRDPTKKEIEEVLENTDFIPMPQCTENKQKIFLYRILTNDPEKYNFVNALKTFFLFSDVRMIVEQDFPDGEIPIFDMKNFTVKHLTKIVLPVLKKYLLYAQEAHPIKLKEIHLLNVPPFVDRLMVLVRPFLKNEVAKMIHFHLPNSESLYEYIPRQLFPEEYGGNEGKIANIKSFWHEKVINNKEYLMDKTRWKVEESKRPVENINKGKELFGMQGSFRSLNID